MRLIQLKHLTRRYAQHFPKLKDVNSKLPVIGVSRHNQRQYSCLNALDTSKFLYHNHVQNTTARLASDRPYYIDSEYFIFNEVVRYSQMYLECVHDILGVGWCTAIVIGVFPLRALVSVIMRRYQINNQVEVVKMDKMLLKYAEELDKKSETFEWRRKHKFLQNKRQTAMYCQRLVTDKKKELYQERGASPAKTIVMGILPLPQWIAFSMALRHEIGSPAIETYFNIPWQWYLRYPDAVSPEMFTGGMLWFQNLTVCDPLYILPLVTSAGFLLLNEIRTLLKPKTTNKTDDSRLPMALRTQNFIMSSITNFIRFWSIFSLTIFWNAPAMTQFYWACSSVIALVTNFALLHSKVEISLLKKENREYALKHKIVGNNNYGLMAKNFKALFKKDSS